MRNQPNTSARFLIRSKSMLASALPFVALAMHGNVAAQDAVNSASVAAPPSVTDPVSANNSASDSDTIFAAIVATNDTASGVNGASGATGVANAFDGDTVNGSPANSTNATLSIATPATPNNPGDPVPTLNPTTGAVDVPAGTPAGTYTITYEICEAANPTNCQTATITIEVVAAPIVADPDTASGINGANGQNDVVDVLDGDTLNGAPATLAEVDITVLTPATPANPGDPVPVLDPATGTVDVPAGTPAGTYTIGYQICEELNPTNCSDNVVTINVDPSPIVATNDTATGINGADGATGVINAFTGDTINGAPADATNATLAVAPGSSVPAGLTFDTATGNVDVAPGTPAGVYTFDYQICEALNRGNCQTATISVTVDAAVIAADPDTTSGVNGATGANDVLDVLDGDTLNGAPATLADVDTTVLTPATPVNPGDPVPVLDPATGTVDVPSGTPTGTYTIAYQICEELNPANCSDNVATISVDPSPVVATNDTVSGINGADGATGVVDAFAGDTINGAPANTTNATLSVAPGSSVPANLTFDPATGNVDVAAGTPAGVYSFDYQICEALNPGNCQTATISVTVDAAVIAADPDATSGVNGAIGATDVLDVLDGDTLNGGPATLADVDITVLTPATPANPGDPVPVLDPATGTVDVPAGTPAGTYTIAYQICEELNPTNCSDSVATINVDAAAILADDDSVGAIDGATGASGVVDVLDGDTLNGAPATLADVDITILAPATPVNPGDPVPTLNPATGLVDVPAGTPAGTYTINYEICEELNPTNCASATVTVSVDAAEIIADSDTATGVNGSIGAIGVVDVLDGDTLNGAPATLADVDISIITPATPANPGDPVPVLNPATGLVDVPAGTPAGTYTITYEICEELNPTNCSQNTVTVTIDASPIVADADSATDVNGADGATGVVDVLDGDTLNGAPATLADVDISVVTPATPANPGDPVPTLDPATGLVDVPAGTPAGTYTVTYGICEELNPTNCSQNTVTISVDAAPIVADDDSVADINGANGATGVATVLDGDTLNGNPATLANVDISVVTPATPVNLGDPVPTLDPSTGLVDVPAGTPAGTYTIEYQICEELNPTNCSTATITVSVDAAEITADPDTVAGVNGATGANGVVDVLDGDTLNAAPATLADVDISVVTPATPANPGDPVPTLNAATGLVDVPAGTPAGTYTITYEICEELNPTNCSQNTVTVTIDAAPIIADDDTVAGVNGADGCTGVIDVLDGDTLNGAPATLADVDISVLTAATPANPGDPVPSLNPVTGLVDVPAGTPAGTYTIEYQICEELNPTNCSTSTVSVTVDAAPIFADPDTVSDVNGADGASGVVDVLDGDTLNGAPATLDDVDISAVTPATPANPGDPVPALDPATGLVDVPAGTPAGTYTITYEICEELNPTNCSQNTVSITVDAAPIVADPDEVTGINGADGATGVADVLDGDTLNGAPATLDDVDISVVTPASPTNPGDLVPTLDPATGLVDVPAGTPAGTYTITYEICEELNPTNCSQNTVTIEVQPPEITAGADTPPPVNGADGAPGLINVFDNDTLNGKPVDPDETTATVQTPATPITPGAPVPTLDPETGLVDVPAGTPAGTYTIEYEICEDLNPTNCATASVTIVVEAPEIILEPDTPDPVRGGIGNPSLTNVLSNDTLNGDPINPDDVTISVTPGTGDPGIVLDPATGNVSVGPDVPPGTYVIEYEVCEVLNPTNCATSSVTIVVDPAISSVEGTVFLDTDSNGEFSDGDEPRAGWIVEIRRGDQLVGTAVTDQDGNYRFEDLLSGADYSIQFRNPENNVVYGRIEDIELAQNTNVIDQNLPIDPSGVVYNSVTRAPVGGAVVSLLGPNGMELPEICFLDPSQQTQTTGPSGEYRFDIIPGAASQCPTGETEYTISVAPPGDFSFVSTVLLPEPDALDPTGLTAPVRISNEPTAPTEADPTYFLTFELEAGDPDVIYNHIPIDPFLDRDPLVVTKTSTKRDVSTGDLVPYEISVRNAENVQRAGVTIVDLLPSGFKYVLGSAAVNGVPTEPTATNSNRQLEWRDQTIPANTTVTYSLVLTVGAGVTEGTKVNTGFGLDGPSGAPISNRGSAAVRIVPSSVFDCSELIGKVFEDANRNGYQDEGEPGVPAARLATVNGLLVTTDEFGRFHIACAAVPNARIGSNFVLKLDTRSLPLGWVPTTDNPRSIRLTRGKMGELNFGVAPPEQDGQSQKDADKGGDE